MFTNLLSDTDKKNLAELAELLAFSDKPLLWDGKTSAAFSSSIDFDAISISVGTEARELIAELKAAAGIDDCPSPAYSGVIKHHVPLGTIFGYSISIPVPFADEPYTVPAEQNVRERLVEALKRYPLNAVENPEIRLEAASTILKELLWDKGESAVVKRLRGSAYSGNREYKQPQAPRVILYELMRVALCDGPISSIQLALLKEFQHHCQLEDALFDDLLERAKAPNQKAIRTCSSIPGTTPSTIHA
jgi:hypothetical protein